MIGDQFARLMQRQIAAAPRIGTLQSMFLEDDKAVLFDFSTTANLYQDPKATTAAAVGSPVGAMLDVSRSPSIAPKYVGNVNLGSPFTSGAPAVATLTPNFGVGPDGTAGGAARLQISRTLITQFAGVGGTNLAGLVPNLPMVYSYWIKSNNGSTQTMATRANWGGANVGPSIGTLTVTPEWQRVILSDNSSDTDRQLQLWASGGVPTLEVDVLVSAVRLDSGAGVVGQNSDILLYPVTGVFQATTANMPTLRQTPTTGRYWLESIDANRALNITTPTAWGTMYVGRVTPEGVVWSTENWSTTTKNVLGGAGSYSAGMIARGREFTAAEKALIEAYFARQLPELGANLFANPDFETDTVWAKGVGWSIAEGVATIVKADGSAGSSISQSGIATIGKAYMGSYTVSRYVSGVLFWEGMPTPAGMLGGYSIGVKKVYATASGTLQAPRAGPNAANFDIDTASLREIL